MHSPTSMLIGRSRLKRLNNSPVSEPSGSETFFVEIYGVLLDFSREEIYNE